jgi:hypothetical protein
VIVCGTTAYYHVSRLMNEKDWKLGETGRALGTALDIVRAKGKEILREEDMPTVGGSQMVRYSTFHHICTRKQMFFGGFINLQVSL